MGSFLIETILTEYDKVYPIRLDMEGAGFGAVILLTINQIRYCERNNFYPIIAYDVDSKNAFFDASRGDSMWEQYFDPVMPVSYEDFQKDSKDVDLELKIVRLTSKEAIQISEEDPESVYSFPFGKWRSQDLGDLKQWYKEQRRKGRETVGRYVKPNKHILGIVDAFYDTHFDSCFVLGVHIRGTDLHYAPAVSPAEYFPYIDMHIDRDPSLKILLATDQAQYVTVFEQRYGKHIVYSDSFRSNNEIAPFQRDELSPYRKGEDVLIDILLLSRSNLLLKGNSNVGEMAMYFNPELECIDLGYIKKRAFGQDYGAGWDNMSNPPAWQLVSKRGLNHVAADASSQSWLQSHWYIVRKNTKAMRVRLGAIRMRLKKRYKGLVGRKCN